MPRLPDALGTPDQVGVVSPDPSRIIPHYEAGQVGAAMQRFGDIAGQAGNQIQDVQDRISRAAAEQDFISRKLDIDQQFAGDTDYATAPQRYRQALLQALNDTSQGILGPVQRADFQQQMSRFTEAGVDTMLRQSVAKARDSGRANITQATGVAVNDALRTPDETDLNPIFNALNDRIQASMEAGYLSPEEAVALRKSTAQSYVSQRGWRLADADPQQAVDTLSPTETSADGQPIFGKAGDWRDLLDAGERTSILGRAQQNLGAQQRAADIEALRQQRQQQKAEADAGNAIAARYVSQLAADPTGVDVAALARENLPESQRPMQQALIGAAETAIAQAGDNGATGYGSGFWQAFNRVTAPDGDPDKINDPAELLRLAGPEGGGALTIQGVQQLQRFLDQNKTVEGRAQSAMEQNFLRQAHAAITGTEAPADLAGETQFQNFLGAYFPALDQGLNSGKSATQLLSAASSDYLGTLVSAFAPPPAQPVADRRDKDAPAQDQAAGAITTATAGPDTNQAAAPRLGTDAMRAWVKDWPVPESGPSMIGMAQSIVRGFADLLDYAHGDLEPGQNISPDAVNALSFFASKSPAAGSGKLITAAAEAKTVGDAQKILGQTSPEELEALARQSAKEAGAPPPDAHSAAQGDTPPAVQSAPTRAAETAGAEAQATGAAQAPGATGGEARGAGDPDQAAAGERGVPGAETRTGPPLSSLFKIPQSELSKQQLEALHAEIEALRARVQLPEFDWKTTHAILFTNEGKIIRFRSDTPADPAYGTPAAKHAEAKAAIWIRENNSSGGILFHNHAEGTCMMCDTNLERLLPEGAKLWVVPPKGVPEQKYWINHPEQYVGNSAQPAPPNPNPQPELPQEPGE